MLNIEKNDCVLKSAKKTMNIVYEYYTYVFNLFKKLIFVNL